jgi:hypothetical protein
MDRFFFTAFLYNRVPEYAKKPGPFTSIPRKISCLFFGDPLLVKNICKLYTYNKAPAKKILYGEKERRYVPVYGRPEPEAEKRRRNLPEH